MAHHESLFRSIPDNDLARVAGGAARISSRSGSNDQLTLMLTQVTNSIKELATNKNQSDPMQMMLMMMMMGGGGGGGGGGPIAMPPPAPPPQPVVNISTHVRR